MVIIFIFFLYYILEFTVDNNKINEIFTDYFANNNNISNNIYNGISYYNICYFYF